MVNFGPGGGALTTQSIFLNSGRVVNFGPGGGVLTTQSILYVRAQAAQQLTGTGTITAHGIVSDQDLVFDSTASLVQTFNFSGPGQNVTLNLDLASAPSSNGILGAGYLGNGSLSICNGVTVQSDGCAIGYNAGSSGVVTVEGPGSTWNCTTHLNSFNVGASGSGTLNIVNGGTVNTINGGGGGVAVGSNGVVNVNGTGSAWTANAQSFSVGGKLNITAGGVVNSQLSNGFPDDLLGSVIVTEWARYGTWRS